MPGAGFNSNIFRPPVYGGHKGKSFFGNQAVPQIQAPQLSVNQPQMPYQPQAPKAQGLIDPLAQAGQGLLDPNSDYYKALSQEMSRNIGEQTDAQQRAAVMRASMSGLGAGASPELLATQGDIGRSGLEAQGRAESGLALQAPALGGQLLSPALSAQLGLQSNDLQAYLAQQQLAAQQQGQQADLNMNAQRLNQELMLREMQLMGLGGGY